LDFSEIAIFRQDSLYKTQSVCEGPFCFDSTFSWQGVFSCENIKDYGVVVCVAWHDSDGIVSDNVFFNHRTKQTAKKYGGANPPRKQLSPKSTQSNSGISIFPLVKMCGGGIRTEHDSVVNTHQNDTREAEDGSDNYILYADPDHQSDTADDTEVKILWLEPNMYSRQTSPLDQHDLSNHASEDDERKAREEKHAAGMAQSLKLQRQYKEGEATRLKLEKQAVADLKKQKRAQKLAVKKEKVGGKRQRQSKEDPCNVQYGASFDWTIFGFK